MAIGSLTVGDQVTAYDPSTGKSSTQTVQHVWVNHDHDLLDVTLHEGGQDGHATQASSTDKTQRVATKAHGSQAPPSDETIHTTEQHPWLTTDRGWVTAGELRVGEHVIELGGRTATITALHVRLGAADYYNLTVSTLHTYAVGKTRAVVHNCGGDIYSSPHQFAHERAHELQDLLPEVTGDKVTMAVAVVEDETTGGRAVMIGTSEKSLRSILYGEMSMSELANWAGGDLHAEQNILKVAPYRAQRVIAMGAGRAICEVCEQAIIDGPGIDAIASPTRSGFIPEWMRE